MGQPPPSSRLPSLDGWRAVSIVIVLAAHSRYVSGFPARLSDPVGVLTDAGDLGVRCFFLISGFLITWLLLCENAAAPGHGVSLKHFYVRRALRIFPVYFFFLAVVAGLQLVTPFRQGTAVWLGNLTFTTNFFGDGRLTGHLWSLAIEEQFYLVWPGVFTWFAVAAHGRRAWWILGVLVVIGPTSRILVCKHYYPGSLKWFFGYFPTTSFADAIAIGCGCALLLFDRRAAVADYLRKNSARLPLVCVFLLVIPMLMNQFQVSGRLQALLGNTMQAAGFSLLLLDSVTTPEKAFYRWLNWRWVKHLGALSYSIYIWQQLFCSPRTLGMEASVWWMSFPGWLLPVLVAAHVSYYGLERPFFNLRKRYRSVQAFTLTT